MIGDFKFFILRDLGKVRDEIGKYSDERRIWTTTGEIPNSAGNLCLHLIGNLNHFIGTQLGNSGYIRERDLEFSDTGIARDGLLASIDSTLAVIERTMSGLSDQDLQQDFPLEFFDETVTTGWVLMHLATHLNYHLGQINYHRRLLDVSSQPNS